MSQVEAEVIVYAIGGFQGALYPKDIPGREEFHGEIFHSAEWRHDVILKNKRVGVIGNGCSAYVFSGSFLFLLCESCLIQRTIYTDYLRRLLS